MRALLSTIGSRGDVQPLLALALELRAQGHQSRVCAPPDFRELIEGYDVPFVPVGPEVRQAGSRRSAAGKPSPEAMRQVVRDTIGGQFAMLGKVADDCDVVVAGGALQFAARSIAEQRGIAYFFAAYCPIILPSPDHAPPPLPGEVATNVAADNCALWDEQAQRWNELFGAAINEQRAAAGLDAVSDARSHMFTDRPLLAADPTLAPWPAKASDLKVVQTGPWIVSDQRPLFADLEDFLAGVEPPILFRLRERARSSGNQPRDD